MCTRNRAPQLERSLTALRALQPSSSWELVLVDNGSSDNTSRVIEAFGASGSLPLRAITEQRVGLSRARNAGWRTACGKIVCFTDDDCYPQAGYVDTVVRAFNDPAVGFFGGRLE